MCNVKYIICTIFCICTYCHAVTACSDSSTNRFSYKIIEKFDYCWDNNIICADTNFTDTTLFSRPSKRRHRIFHIALREELVLKI